MVVMGCEVAAAFARDVVGATADEDRMPLSMTPRIAIANRVRGCQTFDQEERE